MTRNPRLVVLLNACHFALFPIPTITLFWQHQIGMSLADIMVLQAVFSIAVVVLEFPSGYFADRVGYRAAMLVGAALWCLGWLAYALGESFGAMVAAALVSGAGAAFISGADRALLWVSLEAQGRASDYTRWDGRVRAAAQASEAASAAGGGWLYTIAPRLPLWVQVPVAAAEFAAAFRMTEAARHRPAEPRRHLARVRAVVRGAFWHNRRLPAAIALSVALGLATFVMVWLIQPWMQSRGIPPAWFGPLWAAAHLWLALVSLASARIVAALGERGALLGCCLLVPIGYAGLAWSRAAPGVLFYLCLMTVRGVQHPILATVMQREAPPDDRASVLSLAALAFSLAFVLIGPAVGTLADRAGMDVTLGVLAAGFTAVPLAAFARFAARR